SVSALHCNVVKEGDPRELVAANRAITFGSAVRRKPNAFTLVHQMKMVAAHGVDDMEAFGEGFAAWTKASELAEAYKIGRSESTAAMHLLKNIDAPIVERLTTLVRQWTMGKFMTHDSISIFARDACTSSAATSAWQAQLLNTPQILHLLCDRLNADFTNLAPKFRRPFTFSQVEPQRKQRFL
ncbi:Uncharacterized protein SCF082_LOCUS37472, partial [Durusdinium trenchii]